jgi:hypothetical protein
MRNKRETPLYSLSFLNSFQEISRFELTKKEGNEVYVTPHSNISHSEFDCIKNYFQTKKLAPVEQKALQPKLNFHLSPIPETQKSLGRENSTFRVFKIRSNEKGYLSIEAT